ncbi:oligopeptide transporter, OPT family [candidate division GN15 bacterium]|nr:oligopeptide transporter, OPT family [candidate division GN15 bacterium]
MADSNNAKSFKPFITADKSIPEVTWKAIILGAFISVLFGVANAYLGLKFGMTVSASIPAAVISMAILRMLFGRNVTVLENNIVQTVGSAGESLAAGIIFTIPAFFIWAANEQLVASGYDHEVSKMQIFWLSMLGGSLGILLMIPLRKYLVDREHGNLRFPEGTACAEIIVAGDEGGDKAKTVFTGIAVGALYKIGMNMLKGWSESVNYEFKGFLKGGYVGVDATPALLGVGFIIGPRIAALMLSGAVLGYLGVGPLIAFIGEQIPGIIISPGEIPISEMDTSELRNSYIKYLGVGAVAVGGFVSLIKSLPVIVSSFGEGFSQLIGRKSVSGAPRTDRDIPMKWVLLAVTIIIVVIWALPGTELHILGAFMAVLFGFFFVVVAARIVGIVGSSSSPVSGMTIATLLVTCLILLYFGVSGVAGMVTAMSVGTIVCIAVCMSGDIAQDLKTGFLLGATPRKQQLTEFIGLLFPAIAMGFTLYFLNEAFGFVEGATNRTPLLAPQANVMATVVQGVMNANLPWQPIIVGGMIALAVELLGISSLPFAIGLYLPLSLSTPIMAGGLIAFMMQRTARSIKVKEARSLRGVLFASGIVAGDALVGVLVAFMIGSWTSYADFYDGHEGMMNTLTGAFGPWLSLIAFAALASMLAWMALRGFSSKR